MSMGDLERLRRFQPPHSHGDVAPASRPFWHEVASDAAVQVEQEMLVERRGGKELLFVKGEFDEGDSLGQQRG